MRRRNKISFLEFIEPLPARKRLKRMIRGCVDGAPCPCRQAKYVLLSGGEETHCLVRCDTKMLIECKYFHGRISFGKFLDRMRDACFCINNERLARKASGITKVRKARAAAAGLDRARKLGERKDRHVEFARHAFERAGYFSYLLHQGDIRTVKGGRDELQVINDHEAEAFFHFHTTRDRTHREDGVACLVVDEDGCLAQFRDAGLQALILLVPRDLPGAQAPGG